MTRNSRNDAFNHVCHATKSNNLNLATRDCTIISCDANFTLYFSLKCVSFVLVLSTPFPNSLLRPPFYQTEWAVVSQASKLALSVCAMSIIVPPLPLEHSKTNVAQALS